MNCSQLPTHQETEEQQESVSFTNSYDKATNRFKSMTDDHVSSLTITLGEIRETERYCSKCGETWIVTV